MIKAKIDYSDGTSENVTPEMCAKMKAARIAKGLSQAQLAEKVGCTQKDVSRWESGAHEPSIANLKKLAAALACKVDEII